MITDSYVTLTIFLIEYFLIAHNLLWFQYLIYRLFQLVGSETVSPVQTGLEQSMQLKLAMNFQPPMPLSPSPLELQA